MVNQALAIQSNDWQVMTSQAEILVKSGFLPKSIDTKEKALAIMMKGQELGVPAWTALTGIYIIQGQPTVSPQLMLALINSTGQLEDIKIDGDNASCTVVMKRKGRTEHSETFTTEDARKMQLDGKDNWKKQVAVMLKWRAVSACARVVFPDVIMGLYTTEEINPDYAVDEDGVIIEGTFSKPETKASKPASEPAKDADNTDELLTAFEMAVPNVGAFDILGDNPVTEQNLLSALVESNTPVYAQSGTIVKASGVLYLALDLGFNPTKQVIMMEADGKAFKPDGVEGELISFAEAGLVRLERTKQGNYKAFPYIAS